MSTPPPPGGYQPPGPPQNPAMHGYPPQQAAPRNGLGTAALVLGIIGIVFAFIPFVWWIGTILGGLALIFGLIGQSRARKGAATNKGAALTGWLLGAVAIVLSIVFMVMAALAVNDAVRQFNEDMSLDAPAANSQQNGQNQQGDAQPAQGGGQPQDQPTQAGIGDEVTDSNLTFTVTGVDETGTLGEGFMATQAQGKYVIVNLEVRNTGNEAATFNAGPSQVAYDSDGREYSTSSDAMMTGNNSFLEQINPGSSVEGRLVYDIPQDVKLTRVHLQGGFASPGAEVSLK